MFRQIIHDVNFRVIENEIDEYIIQDLTND